MSVTFARTVGTAPGTTTIQFPWGPRMTLGAAPSAPYPYINPPSPTQAVYEPDPFMDNVRIALPPGQHVTSPMEISVQVPTSQAAMGPVTNDLEAVASRGYLPARKGWILSAKGPTIFNLQGRGLGEMTASEKLTVATAVVGTAALIISTTLAVLRYRNGK